MSFPVPIALHNASEAAELRVEWADGQVHRLSHARLRAACLCAQCRAARLQGRIVAIEEGIRLKALHDQGYGVQLVFDDGHDRGIYPWSYLYELARKVQGG